MAIQQILATYAAGGGGGGPGAHRYWRINITANNGDASFIGFSEIALRDSSGTNRSAGSTGGAWVSASSTINASNNPRNTVDGNTSGSGWLSNSATPPQWIAYDHSLIGSPAPNLAFEVKTFDMWASFNAPAATPQDFTLEWSDDAVSWTVALSVTGQTGWVVGTGRTFTVF